VRKNRVVVVEPHMDDAFLGCSALLKLGLVDKLITMADGSIVPKSLQSKYSPEQFTDIRFEETAQMTKKYNIYLWDYFGDEDGKLELGLVSRQLNNVLDNNDTVFIPSIYETHKDHLVVAKTWNLLKCKKIITYAVNNWIPNFDVNMATTGFPFKMQEFFELYPSQKGYPTSTLVKEEYYKVIK
jgi:hypothetical protein